MKRVALIATLASLLAAALGPAAPAGAATAWRDCGSQPQTGAGWYNVRALNVGCRGARAVARRYQFDPTPYGFGCQSRRTGIESRRYFCRRAEDGLIQKVRFTYGA